MPPEIRSQKHGEQNVALSTKDVQTLMDRRLRGRNIESRDTSQTRDRYLEECTSESILLMDLDPEE